MALVLLAALTTAGLLLGWGIAVAGRDRPRLVPVPVRSRRRRPAGR